MMGAAPESCDCAHPPKRADTDEMIRNALKDLADQANPEADHEALLKRYPKAAVGDFDGKPGELTEMDALIAYLQILGRMVDFTKYGTGQLQQ